MLKYIVVLCIHVFRHTDEMIEKLETAGLGYYVKADSTQHKFGMYIWIPMCFCVFNSLFKLVYTCNLNLHLSGCWVPDGIIVFSLVIS